MPKKVCQPSKTKSSTWWHRAFSHALRRTSCSRTSTPFCCVRMAFRMTGSFERSLRIAVRGGWLTKTSSTSGAGSAGPLLSVSASRPLLLLWSQLCGPWVGSLSHSALGSKLRRHRPWNAGLSRRPLGLSALCRLWSVWNAAWRCSSWLPSRRTSLCRTPATFFSGGVQVQGLAVAGAI